MTETPASQFVYVIFIRASPQRLWEALTDPEIMRQYWFGMHQECDWTPGAAWKLRFADGRIADGGHIVEIDPPRRLVIHWQNEFRPELKSEGPALCTYELEPMGDATRLTITHRIAQAESKLIEAVSGGWPRILSNLKSFLETGRGLLEG